MVPIVNSSYEKDVISCFVLMPFANNFTDVFTNGIHPTIRKIEENYGLDIIVRRADEIITKEIVKEIIESIKKADFIIADITNLNPNVIWEVGLCCRS